MLWYKDDIEYKKVRLHFYVQVVLVKYCRTFVAKLRCEWAKVWEPCDGKNVATSRSPNAGWLALHFWPKARKVESFQHATGILGQTLPLFSLEQISTWHQPKGWNHPILKTWQTPLKPSLHHMFHCTFGEIFTRRLPALDWPATLQLDCPFYAPCSLCFSLSCMYISSIEYCTTYILHWDTIFKRAEFEHEWNINLIILAAAEVNQPCLPPPIFKRFQC